MKESGFNCIKDGSPLLIFSEAHISGITVNEIVLMREKIDLRNFYLCHECKTLYEYVCRPADATPEGTDMKIEPLLKEVKSVYFRILVQRLDEEAEKASVNSK